METIIICMVFILAGISTELTGFGVATISMALLPFFLPLSLAVPLIAGISTVSTGIVAYRTKTLGLWRYMLPLVLGSAVGIPLGMFMLKGIDEGKLLFALAMFLIIYSIYGIFGRLPSVNATPTKSSFMGVIAGFSNATLNIHGPIVGLYATSDKKFSRNETRDIIATYMFFAGVFTVSGHYLSGNINEEIITYFLYALPFLFIGLFIGSKIFNKLNKEGVKKFIFIFILIAGFMMLY